MAGTKKSPPRPTAEMGERIRSAREAAGLSTQTAAEAAGISTGYLFKIESGVVGTPSPRVLHRVGDAVGVGYWDLMKLAGYVVPDGEQPAPAPRPAPAGGATNELIVELLEEIREDVRALRAASA